MIIKKLYFHDKGHKDIKRVYMIEIGGLYVSYTTTIDYSDSRAFKWKSKAISLYYGDLIVTKK